MKPDAVSIVSVVSCMSDPITNTLFADSRIANMKFGARTDKGMHRTLNEDLYFVDEKSSLFVVADGVDLESGTSLLP